MQRLKFLLVMFFAVLDQATGTSFLTNENVENSTFSNTPTENLRTLLKGSGAKPRFIYGRLIYL